MSDKTVLVTDYLNVTHWSVLQTDSYCHYLINKVKL
jgi:hypothetical protein